MGMRSQHKKHCQYHWLLQVSHWHVLTFYADFSIGYDMTEKDKGGRPLVELTDKQISEVETLAAILSTEQIADYFGISRATWYNIMERNDEVFRHYKKGKARAIASVASNLVTKANSGDLGAQIFFLKTQAGWKETQKIEGGGENGDLVVAYKWLDDDDTDDQI